MNMPRQARKKSESGIYHVMLRGIKNNQGTVLKQSGDGSTIAMKLTTDILRPITD